MTEPESPSIVACALWAAPPSRCPFCGGGSISCIDSFERMTNAELRLYGVEWTLEEWQCCGTCEGRSFFV